MDYREKIGSVANDTIRPNTIESLAHLRKMYEATSDYMVPAKIELGPEERTKELRIGIISLPVTNLLEAFSKRWRGESYHYYLLERNFEKHFEIFEENILIASEHGAQFICLNELSFPNSGNFMKARKARKLFQKLRRIAIEKRIFIIAGSYHDQRELFNVSPIFHPQIQSQTNPEAYKKLSSAFRAGEYIRVPNIRRIQYYETPYGKFSIFLCLDSYDLSLVSRLIISNYRWPRDRGEREYIDILFVPSLNPDMERAPEICLDISFTAANLVIFTNCKTYQPNFGVFLGGKDLVKEGNYITEVNEYLKIFSITKDTFNLRRLEAEEKYRNALKYVLSFKPDIDFSFDSFI